jgi:hypothetical protein
MRVKAANAKLDLRDAKFDLRDAKFESSSKSSW